MQSLKINICNQNLRLLFGEFSVLSYISVVMLFSWIVYELSSNHCIFSVEGVRVLPIVLSPLKTPESMPNNLIILMNQIKSNQKFLQQKRNERFRMKVSLWCGMRLNGFLNFLLAFVWILTISKVVKIIISLFLVISPTLRFGPS